MFEFVFSFFSTPQFKNGIEILFYLFPIWFPALTITLFIQTWLRYARAKYISEQETILLELKLPKETTKSPAAMEIIIAALAQPGVGSYLDVFLKGRVRPWFSLEIISLGGQVKFFIWTQKKFKDSIETQIYGQFPTVEIYEAPDYTRQVSSDPEKTSLWGMQLSLTKPDIFPLKTYVDYGLDQDPKEEYKIDPITPVIEFLGSLKPDNQIWIQILIQAHRKENLKDARLREKADWKGSAKGEIEKIMKEAPTYEEEVGKKKSFLTDQQKDTINSIQRNLAKIPFDTTIRAIYLAPKENFDSVNIAGLTGVFKQYGSGNLNGFKPGFATGFDYPWQDFRGRRTAELKRKIFDAYRRRSYFHPPYKNFKAKSFVLTTEELATIFHFPGGVASTPTFSRIVSKKAEPPSNLPI